MVETRLTPELIKEGARLVEKLDQAGVGPDAAFWFYFPDIGAWKLFVAETKVAAAGPREVYKQIQKTLQKFRNEITHLSLEDVAVAKSDAPLVALLASAISVAPGLGGIRFSRNVINGVPIEDAYIYRLKRPAA
jgi:hypothetical protein